MNGFFAEPLAGLALAGVALVAWLAFTGERRRARRLAAVVGRRADALAGERSVVRTRRRNVLAVAGLACGVLAWMQPRFGTGPAAAATRGTDLCVCLDVSRSMLAADVAPSRLRAARQAVAALAQRTRGDRMALVEFAGEPRLRVPLTRDVASLAVIAQSADPSDVALGGTDLAAAIDAAVAALAAGRRGGVRGEGRGDDERAPLQGDVLLLTDGEDPSGAGRAAAERARGRGLVVHCVGIGSPLGSKVTIAGPGGRQTFLRDREGRDVVTRLDAASLRALAAAGGGEYVEAAATASPLVAVYESSILPRLDAGANGAGGDAGGTSDGEVATRANRFQLPLALALAALLLDLLLPQRRRRDVATTVAAATSPTPATQAGGAA